ncbi:MAG: hypothetical protein ABJ364_00025 [Lentilitoribacter sp.]
MNKLARPGDVICDTVDHSKGMHPHMSAPAIKSLLFKQGFDPEDYTIFTVTRHPLTMLWSYYKFFEPDENGRYNYSESHDAKTLVPFLSWMENGRIGIGKYWANYTPDFVNDKNFSPLSLEAHIFDREGENHVDKWFSIEEPTLIEQWLSGILGSPVELGRVNASEDKRMPEVPEYILEKLRPQFPMECQAYDL